MFTWLMCWKGWCRLGWHARIPHHDGYGWFCGRCDAEGAYEDGLE